MYNFDRSDWSDQNKRNDKEIVLISIIPVAARAATGFKSNVKK